MKRIENMVVTDRAMAVFRLDLQRHKPRPDEVIVLHFMPSFTNADGTTVAGFAPGYVIDFAGDRKLSGIWAMAHLPDGTSFRFMPKFEWRAGETYVLDRASAYTFSIEPA